MRKLIDGLLLRFGYIKITDAPVIVRQVYKPIKVQVKKRVHKTTMLEWDAGWITRLKETLIFDVAHEISKNNLVVLIERDEGDHVSYEAECIIYKKD